ncbi:MAG: hypothetical protein CUN55_16295, partial [Phototrophicales bacterium]
MKSFISISVLGIALVSTSFTAFADSQHHSNNNLTAVEHNRLDTETNGPKSNDWVVKSSGFIHAVKTGKTASEMGHTAAQHNRMKKENNGPRANDWVVDNSSGHIIKLGPTAREMGLTAVQHSRMKTEDNGPSSN